MAWTTYADVTKFYDEQTVRDLLSDTGDPVQDLSTDGKLSKLLAAARGRLVSACTVSEMYDAADLAALTGDSAALRDEIVCKAFMVGLARRRPEKFSSDYWKAVGEEVEDHLDRLRKGERLFDVKANREAGLPTIDGPTVTTYNTLNMIPDRTRNFYPSRGSRLPLGRST